jgi:hypothetical protein
LRVLGDRRRGTALGGVGGCHAGGGRDV